MGPIQIVFVVMLILFGVYGIVRGYGKELGVTLLLLAALSVVIFLESTYKAQLNTMLGRLFNPNPNDPDFDVIRNLIYCGFLILITYASYQGETLAYPGPRKSPFWGLGVGLFNGYLFAGSLWYYLAKAHWPLLNVDEQGYNEFYKFAVEYLPPALFKDWRLLIALVVILLILRVWK